MSVSQQRFPANHSVPSASKRGGGWGPNAGYLPTRRQRHEHGVAVALTALR